MLSLRVTPCSQWLCVRGSLLQAAAKVVEDELGVCFWLRFVLTLGINESNSVES